MEQVGIVRGSHFTHFLFIDEDGTFNLWERGAKVCISQFYGNDAPQLTDLYEHSTDVAYKWSYAVPICVYFTYFGVSYL